MNWLFFPAVHSAIGGRRARSSGEDNGTGRGIGGLGCSFLVPIRRVRSYNVKQKDWVASVHHRSGALRVVEKLDKVLRCLHYGLAVGSRLGVGSFL